MSRYTKYTFFGACKLKKKRHLFTIFCRITAVRIADYQWKDYQHLSLFGNTKKNGKQPIFFFKFDMELVLNHWKSKIIDPSFKTLLIHFNFFNSIKRNLFSVLFFYDSRSQNNNICHSAFTLTPVRAIGRVLSLHVTVDDTGTKTIFFFFFF